MFPFTAPTEGVPTDAGRREQNRHRVRVAILDAALELFAERGFEETAVRDIAARAGVSAATVARYFPVKEAMLFGESELRTAALYHAVRSRPAGEAPIEAVLAALAEQPPLDRQGQARLAASRRAIARSTVARGRAALFLDVWRGAVAGALRDRGVDGGEADLVAAVTVAVLDAVADRWSQSDDGDGDGPLEPALTAAFETIGWTTPASTERTST